jgi:hypothetical protein
MFEKRQVAQTHGCTMCSSLAGLQFQVPTTGQKPKGLRTNPRQFAQLVVIQGGAKTTAAEHVMHDTHGTGVGVGVGIVPVGWLACRSSCVVYCCKNSTVKQNNIFNGKIKKKKK